MNIETVVQMAKALDSLRAVVDDGDINIEVRIYQRPKVDGVTRLPIEGTSTYGVEVKVGALITHTAYREDLGEAFGAAFVDGVKLAENIGSR